MRVVVIGGGVTGAGAAYGLARAGAETVLVDADLAGRATAAGAGIICPWASRLTDPAWHRIATASAAFYPVLLARLAEDTGDGETATGYRRVGALRLLDPRDPDTDTVHSLIAERAARSPQAGTVSLCEAGEARAMFPPLGHDGPAVHIAGGARVDGRLLGAALRRGAARRGARLVTGRAEIAVRGERVAGVRVDGELLAADAVVDASGAWSPGLLEPLGVSLPVVPQRGQIAHLRLPDADTARWPVVFPLSAHYLLAFEDSRVVAGATREDGTGFDHRVTAAGLAEVLNEALTVAPGLADAELLSTRVGFRPVGPPDGLPLLGRIPRYEGLVVANGLAASGLTIGPYAGVQAARLALGEQPDPDLAPDLDLTPYDPGRCDLSPQGPPRRRE